MNIVKWIFVILSAFGGGVAATNQANPNSDTATQAIGGAITVLTTLPALLKKSPVDPPTQK